MPVNKFGSTDTTNSTRVVSGGVTLTQVKNTFLQRDGANAATGDINLDSHKLINVRNPDNAQDAVTKAYCDEKLDDLSKGLRTLNNHVVNDIERIDRVNAGLKTENQSLFDRVHNAEKKRDTYIDIESLLKVGNIISMLHLGVIGSTSYFAEKLRQVQTLYDTISKLYKGETVKKLKEFENQKFVCDFRNEVMRAILEISEDEFIRLKANLESNKLLKNVEEGTVSMDFSRVVNKLDRALQPGMHKYNEYKLIAQKNLILIQLGYIFIHEGLLKVATE